MPESKPNMLDTDITKGDCLTRQYVYKKKNAMNMSI